MGSAAAARRAAAALRRAGSLFSPAPPFLRPARPLHPPRAGAGTSSPSGSGRAVVVFVRVIVVGSPPRAHTVARPATALLHPETPLRRPATPGLLRPATHLHRPAWYLLRPATDLLRPSTPLHRPSCYLLRARPLHRPATSTSGLAPTGAEEFKLYMEKLFGRLDSIKAETRAGTLQNAKTAEAVEKINLQNARQEEAIQKILAKQEEVPKKDWGSITIWGRTLNLPGFVSLAWKALDTFKG